MLLLGEHDATVALTFERLKSLLGWLPKTVTLIDNPFLPMASSDGPWALDAASREETISRLTANIASLAFAKGVSVALEDARSAAVTAEKRAYNVAGVESRTTTGYRPQSESLRAYTRSGWRNHHDDIWRLSSQS